MQYEVIVYNTKRNYRMISIDLEHIYWL